MEFCCHCNSCIIRNSKSAGEFVAELQTSFAFAHALAARLYSCDVGFGPQPAMAEARDTCASHPKSEGNSAEDEVGLKEREREEKKKQKHLAAKPDSCSQVGIESIFLLHSFHICKGHT